ncbi:hypothetical protein Y695_01597 [Hydrogenophaga sp. T4]|nr:hypothetical protein Y695_01597 [Hydrogenophaga sp. T4]
MTDAMQITVSSEIANRMDDNSSTSWLAKRDPVRICKPWVDTVI